MTNLNRINRHTEDPAKPASERKVNSAPKTTTETTEWEVLGASGGYRFLEHVTDAFVEAWGETLEEAFSQAGLALFETMLDVKSVQPKTDVEIQTNGHDEKELLYNYLEELLLLFEVKQLALGDFSVSSITPTQGEIRLKGKTRGEPYDRSRHNGKVEVKGITYHLMEIEKHLAKVTVRFLLDL